MTENKRFDFEEEYITLDGGVFATAKNKHDAELISKTFNQLYEENKELKSDRDYWKTLAQSLAKKNGG